MMVTRPLATPNSSVKLSAAQKLAPPSISTRNDSGMQAIDTRPTSIGCHARASVRSQMRPTTCATPFSEARNTAAVPARPVASRIGTRCTASAPNTTALAATIRLNRAMAMVREVPSRVVVAAIGVLAAADAVGSGTAATSRRASPTQCSGRQTRRFMAAKISSV